MIAIEDKRAIYKLHESCICILTIQQERIEGRIDQRTDVGWSDTTLKELNDLLVLADFGLRCQIADLYRRTALLAHPARKA